MNRNIFYFLLSQVLFLACSKSPEQMKTTSDLQINRLTQVQLTSEQFNSLGIQLGKVEERQISSTIKVNGVLDVPPQNMVTISAPLGGFVKYTELLQGMSVKQGQVLVTMEHPDYIQLQQDYIESKNQLEFMELEYKRQQELAAENVNAAKTLQQSKSNYLSTKAKVDGLRAKLKLININPSETELGEIKNSISIVSPISGFVTQVHVNIGMHVNPTEIMFKIVDTHHLHAEAQVFEKDLAKLKVGQNVHLFLANDVRERKAKVYLIGKEISTERTVRVHCHFDEEDPALIPGMYFNGVIETGGMPKLTVPESALVNYEGRDYVFASKSETLFELQEVTRGITDAGYVEVAFPEKFDRNTTLVVQGAYSLISKLKNVED